jgi:hypothetical protein
LESIEQHDLADRIGRPFETAHDPVGEVYLHLDADHAEILYVAADPFPPADYWQGGTRGRIADRAATDSPLVLPIDVTEDGAGIGRLSFDPEGSAAEGKVLVAPDTLVAGHRAGRVSFADFLQWGERQVGSYDAWRKGEVYGVVRESLSLSRGSSGLPDTQADWAVLDLAGAERLLRETVERREAELGPQAGPRP